MNTRVKERSILINIQRKLLLDGFSVDELKRKIIFPNFKELYYEIEEINKKTDVVQELLDYVDRKNEQKTLLDIIHTLNPKSDENKSDLIEILKIATGGRPESKETREIAIKNLSTLKTYVGLLDKCIDLIEKADSNRQGIRNIRNQLKILLTMTISEDWNIENATNIIDLIYIPFERLWRHVKQDFKQIKIYEEKLDIDKEQKEAILLNSSSLINEIDKLLVIKEMYAMIHNSTGHDSSDIINRSKKEIDNFKVRLEELDESVSEIRLDLFNVLKSQVERFSEEFYDSLV